MYDISRRLHRYGRRNVADLHRYVDRRGLIDFDDVARRDELLEAGFFDRDLISSCWDQVKGISATAAARRVERNARGLVLERNGRARHGAATLIGYRTCHA